MRAPGLRTPEERVGAALDRIASTEGRLRAWVRVDGEGALAAAHALAGHEPGPLHGIPFGVKDIIDVAGLPTECGSPLRAGRVAGADAEIVARLRSAGALPVGKTVTTEFAYFAPGPTRNPHDPLRTPGGSSSGSAAAVAAGVVPFALGSQTAGSLTRPASYCGAAALVAPVGALSTAGIEGLAPSLDAPGLLTRRVEELRPLYAVLARRPPTGHASVVGARFAVWSGTELVPVEEPMRRALEQSSTALVRAGATVRHFDRADLTTALTEAHGTVMAYEAARSLAVEARTPDSLSAPLAELLARGRTVPDAEHRAALDLAAAARAQLLDLLDSVDAILGPAAPGVAPRGLSATGSPVLSRPWQLLGLPALTVPGHRDPAGLPLGLQLVGHPGRVGELLALGEAVERLASG